MGEHLAIATAIIGGLGGLFGLIMLVYRFMATMLGEKFINRLDHQKLEERNQHECIRNRLAQSSVDSQLREQIQDLSNTIAGLTDEVHNIGVNIEWIKDSQKRTVKDEK